MGITGAIQAFFRRLGGMQDPDPLLPGRLMEGFDGGRIVDGVDYSQPVIVTEELREMLGTEGRLSEYLMESYRTATRHQFDSPYASGAPVTPVTEDPLREWDYATRKRVLTNTHAAYSRNPIAKRAVDYIQSYVVGDGFKVTARCDEVREVLDDFIDHPDNQIRKYERQAVVDLCVDGEIVLRYFEEGGMTAVVPMRPWELEYIRTQLGFFRRPELYVFQLIESQGDDPSSPNMSDRVEIPAREIQFVAINNHGYELRGRPEIYSALPWLQAYKDWLENRSRINYYKSILMWLVQVDATNPASVASVMARYSKPPTPGSIAVESAKVDIKPLTGTINAADARDDGRALKLMTAVGIGGIPEYMLSDGQNANLASANKQELPVLTTFGEFQRCMVEEVWAPMFKRVVQNAVDAGLIPAKVQPEDADGDPIADAEMIDAVDAFEVSYEPLQQADILQIAQAMTLAMQNELISKEGAQLELGIDPMVENKRMERESSTEIERVARGARPPAPVRRDAALDDDGLEEPETA